MHGNATHSDDVLFLSIPRFFNLLSADHEFGGEKRLL